ncbi:hypothetical protein [Cellulomonas sp. P5_C6]
MSADLHELMNRAADEIEGSAAPLPGGRLDLVRSAARRRRIARRTTESFAGVAAVAVVGVGVWFGAADRAPQPVTPVVTASPIPTPTSTPAPTTSPTPTPTGPAVRAESIDDATVVARLSAPRTGEVWETPVRVPELDATLIGDDGYGTRYGSVYRVGTRGEATIYVVVEPESYGGSPIGGLYEIDAAGARSIACPSARTGDPCMRQALEPSAVVRDEATFYDTLTLPHAIDLGDGYVVTTTRTTTGEFFDQWALGYGTPLLGGQGEESTVLVPMGAQSLVAQTHASSFLDGVTNVSYALTLPLGSTIELGAQDAPGGDYAAITWDDGVQREGVGWGGTVGGAVAMSPGDSACFGGTFAEEADHVASQWRAAGTTPDGHRVYVPVDGGNPLSRAVRAWHEENSGTLSESGEIVTGVAAGYPYADDAGFLAADALYAIQAPDDRWLVGLRSDAVQVVWECA